MSIGAKLEWKPIEIKRLDEPGDPICYFPGCKDRVHYRFRYHAGVNPSQLGRSPGPTTGFKSKFACSDHIADKAIYMHARNFSWMFPNE